MRFAVVLVLLAAVIGAPFPRAEAADGRHVDRPLPDRAFSGPGWRFNEVENFRLQFRQDARRFRRGAGPILVVPPVVVVAPGQCWQDGYWDYQWVPTWDGGGYYQPFWVDGYWAAC
jgi:hypothetical protein